jgi:ACS family hexuronate transporter-like MFS transporter
MAGVSRWLLRVTRDEVSVPRSVFLRRFVVLVVMVVSINVAWHYFRAWLPLFLQEQHRYPEPATQGFMVAYYVATDLGSLAAGFLTLGLARAGLLSVQRSRLVVFLACAVLTALSVVAAQLPAGPLLLALLLVVGFGALGVFPNYYSFSQDLTVRHQGKLTGSLGCCCWLAMAGWQELIGRVVQGTGSYTVCFVIAGLAPLVGFLALVLLWGPPTSTRAESSRPETKQVLPDRHLRTAAGPAGQHLRPQ